MIFLVDITRCGVKYDFTKLINAVYKRFFLKLLSLIMNMNFNRNFDFSMCTSEKSHGRKFSKERFFSRSILAFSPQRDAFRTLPNIHGGVFLQK